MKKNAQHNQNPQLPITLALLLLSFLTAPLGVGCRGTVWEASAGAENSNNASKRFRVVQMCDSQLGFADYAGELARFQTALEWIKKSSDADVVVICGDLVNDKNDSSYQDVANALRILDIPLLIVPGNHDITPETFPQDTERFQHWIGPEYSSLRHNQYRLIGINTQRYAPQATPELSEAMDDFLQTELEAARETGETPIVVGHTPLYVTDFAEPDTYSNLSGTNGRRQSLWKLFQRYHVLAYLAGHTHTAFLQVRENIVLSCGETTSVSFDGVPAGVRILDFDAGAVRVSSKFWP